MKLIFEGEMDYCADSGGEPAPAIGGRDIIAELEEAWPWKSTTGRPNVRVLLGVELELPDIDGPGASLTCEYTGGLFTDVGFGGGEVTPPESPRILVGDLELLQQLLIHDGKQVVLVVEDA